MSDNRTTAQGEGILAYLERAIAACEHMATEAAAEYGTQWYYDDGLVLARREDDMVATGSQDFLERKQGEHIALNDPASVLRRCAADRKLIALHQSGSGWDGARDGSVCTLCAQDSQDGDRNGAPFPCLTLRTLAGASDEREADRWRARPRIVIEATVESLNGREIELTGGTRIDYSDVAQLGLVVLEGGWHSPGMSWTTATGPLYVSFATVGCISGSASTVAVSCTTTRPPSPRSGSSPGTARATHSPNPLRGIR